MPRRKSADEESEGPTFEEAVTELERIVEAMENQQLPLEDLVTRYEQGSKLLGRCETLLKAARDRVELINLRASGQAADPAAPQDTDPEEADEPETENNDIRLF
jgi:exodeoxyribonuclease VII small subunit